MSRIEIRGAARRFGSNGHGIGPIDLRVEPGEFVAVVGPSGCGKSTLIELIGGLQGCDRGDIAVDGEPVFGPSPDRQIVFQDGALFPWLTVAENVAYGLRAQGASSARAGETVRDVLRAARLEGVARLHPRALSPSLRQRTAIARALVLRPPVLLLDDPFAALDEVARAAIQRELADLWVLTRASTVLVTHSVVEACLLGDRVVVLTAAPGRVAGILEIGDKRPRTARAVAPHVLRIRDLLHALIGAERADEHESLAGTLVHPGPRLNLG